MPRKKWVAKTEDTPTLAKFREKRKWQIALRRYVLEKNPSISYAPYFGLDIEHLRQWFETQFADGIGWNDFARAWQFGQVIPAAYFEPDELSLCWNFTNLRIEPVHVARDGGQWPGAFTARKYFERLYQSTSYPPCLKLLEKIDQITNSQHINTDNQQRFIQQNRSYLDLIEGYSTFEFEMLNSGRSVEEVQKEVEFFKKFDK